MERGNSHVHHERRSTAFISAEFMRTLRETFDMIDTDKSGTIDHSEFGTLLRLQGEDVTDEDARDIMAQIDVDGDSTNLTFDEFAKV